MRRVLLYIIGVMILIGCDDRRTIYDAISITARYTIEWPSDVERPNGASIIFYPRAGSAVSTPVTVLTNALSGTVTLRRGVYDVMVINETINSHDYISFEGTDYYDTFTAMWDITTSTVARTTGTESYDNFVKSSSDPMLVDKLEGVTVTQDMINNYESQDFYFTPTDLAYTLNVIVHVSGLDNAASSGSMLYLQGASRGVVLSSEELLDSYVSNSATLNNRTYDQGSYDTGVMSSSLNIFGFVSIPSAAEVANEVILSFKLRDGTTLSSLSYDIDNLIDIDESTRTITVIIDDPTLILPEVEDTENPDSGSGFETEVGGWGDEINIPVDLNI